MSARNRRYKLYYIWTAMHRRCYDETYHSYHRYGGRGIVVEQPWHNFQEFYNDMEADYESGLTVDRINNDGNYCFGNCRWQTKNQNKKPFKYDLEELLKLKQQGLTQYEIATRVGTDQPHISRLLKKARYGKEA